jgi:hypothetical protein
MLLELVVWERDGNCVSIRRLWLARRAKQERSVWRLGRSRLCFFSPCPLRPFKRMRSGEGMPAWASSV